MQNKTTRIITLVVIIVLLVGGLLAYRFRSTLKGLFSGAAGGPVISIQVNGACHDPDGLFEINPPDAVVLTNSSSNFTAHNMNLTVTGLPDGITMSTDPALPADIGPGGTVVVHFNGTTTSNTFSIRGVFTWDEGSNGFNDRFNIPCNGAPPPPPPVQVVCTPATQNVAVNAPANFTSSGSADSIWVAPDGTPAVGKGKTFTTQYATAGTKTVTLQDGSTTTECMVVVGNPPPGDIICTPASQTVAVGAPANFSASTPAGTQWSAPNGTPSTGTGKTFSTTYSTAGTKIVTMTYQNSTGTCTVVVTTPPGPSPLVCAPATQTVTVAQSANFTATGGTGTYSWTAPEGSPASGNQPTFTTTYASPGSKTVNVTSGNQTKSCAVVVNSSPLTPTADLSLTKTASPTTLAVGANTTYTIKVKNSGPNVPSNVSAKDVLPTGVSYVSNETPSQGSYDHVTHIWTIGSLALNQEVTLKIVAKIEQAGTFTNTSEVFTSSLPDPDSTPNNNIATEDDQASATVTATNNPPVTPEADLNITKEPANSSAVFANNVVFSITLHNSGPNATSGVTVKDTLPSGLDFVSATTQKGTFDSATMVWNVGNMAVNENAALLLTAKANTLGVVENVVEVTASAVHDPDSTPNNHNPLEDDQAKAVVTISGGGGCGSPCGGGPGPSADLSLTKSVDISTPGLNQPFNYTLTLNNAGPNGADNVVVKDIMPSGVVFESFTASQGSYNPTSGDWTVGSIGVGNNAQLHIKAHATATGTFVNTGEVTASSQPDPDSTPNNHNPNEDDQASVTIVVTSGGGGPPPPSSLIDVSLTKVVDNSAPRVGSQITYTIYANNLGPNTATGVHVDDRLPSSLQFVSANASQGSYDAGTGVWNIGSLNVGSTVALQITAKVLVVDNIINVAEETAADQPDLDSTPNNHNPNEDDYAQVTITSVTGPQLVNAGSGTAAGMIGFGTICLILALGIRFRFRKTTPELVGASAQAHVTTFRRY